MANAELVLGHPNEACAIARRSLVLMEECVSSARTLIGWELNFDVLANIFMCTHSYADLDKLLRLIETDHGFASLYNVASFLEGLNEWRREYRNNNSNDNNNNINNNNNTKANNIKNNINNINNNHINNNYNSNNAHPQHNVLTNQPVEHVVKSEPLGDQQIYIKQEKRD